MLKRIIQIEEVIASVFLAAIVICVFMAAIMRSIGYPIIWSVDLAQLLFIWVCMLGANQALRRNEHVGVDFLVRRLSSTNRLKLDVLLYFLIAVLLILLVIFGTKLTFLNPERLLGSTSLPYALVTAAVPVGALLMLLTLAEKLKSSIKSLKSSGGIDD